MDTQAGRPRNNTPINTKLFMASLQNNHMSMKQLADALSNTSLQNIVDEKTIRRIKHSGVTNSKMLNAIAECLDVDPVWLQGNDLKVLPSLSYNNAYMDPCNHPYKAPNRTEYKQLVEELLSAYGISKKTQSLLPEPAQNGLHMFLDLMTVITIYTFFYKDYDISNAFFKNPEIYAHCLNIVNSDDFNKLWEMIEA